MLRAVLPGVDIHSAGIAALVGHAADETTRAVAAEHGLDVDGHVARQFTPELGKAADLILVMEPGHRREIARRAPELAGRTMLFDHWTGGHGIPDPHRQSHVVHEEVHALIAAAANAWARRLAAGE